MPIVDPRIAGKPVPRISKQAMERECVGRVKESVDDDGNLIIEKPAA